MAQRDVPASSFQAILTGTVLIPQMVVRYLLVTSLQALDLEALDTVVEVRATTDD